MSSASKSADDIAQQAFAKWRLTADGAPFATPSSRLYPVRWNGRHAMLKIVVHPDERNGAAALAWFAGQGAVEVLEQEGDALLMARADGADALVDRVRNGDDDDATRIICSVVRALHAPRSAPPPAGLTPLTRRFRALFRTAEAPGADEHYVAAAALARRLLAEPRDGVVLHGDIHHQNILHDPERGWVAIDPKGLIGERAFDYANTLENPIHCPEVVLSPGRLRRQAEVIAEGSGIELRRLLEFTFAFAALSECWGVEDGNATGHALAVSKIARQELG
ncbi:MAG TPA: aminoglycoside phosphotransferase family protein [Caulobacteraceae bacterium]|jgi:streptomycin 6-kinase|nr:aminoglycoside phosphotransferase family protein [Caulobacteraceae bacterium]